ncbi:hypothetical protein [Endozoicomonas sp.]|uniref:hypothetical protein n=1 Tax=Endozoicomonas sp. TaxID=1892382 RepID=UPI00383A25B3
MKVRKTLIFPLENQTPENLTRNSLLYRAANWLETAMRALQEHKEAEKRMENSSLAPAPDNQLITPPRHFAFRRHLMKSRCFMPVRGRLPVCTNLRRIGPHHW